MKTETPRAEIPHFESEFVLLDVTKGRVKLQSYIKKHGPVRVTVEMELDYPASGNDGTSIEFAGQVLSLKNIKHGKKSLKKASK